VRQAWEQLELLQYFETIDPHLYTYTMAETRDASHATRNTAHPHYRIVLETENWNPLYKADRLSQVIAMLDNAVQGEAF
jgi:hypothetical protein